MFSSLSRAIPHKVQYKYVTFFGRLQFPKMYHVASFWNPRNGPSGSSSPAQSWSCMENWTIDGYVYLCFPCSLCVCAKPVSSILQLHFSNMENSHCYPMRLLPILLLLLLLLLGSNCFLFIVWICKLTVLRR